MTYGPDARARIEQIPESVLTKVPEEDIGSRYTDHDHPARGGSLIAFATGGRLVPGQESRGLIGDMYSVIDQAVRGMSQGSGKGKQYYDQHYGEQDLRNPVSKNYRGRRLQGGLYTDAGVGELYLMVINMQPAEMMASGLAEVPVQ
ncbi:MAG: hypothetical protein Q9181_002106 [Wetmoreana brouardii]